MQQTYTYGTRPLSTQCMQPRDATGCRRLTGSSKLQIIFHKRATKYRSLLRTMTYKDKGSYESSPPCTTPKRLTNKERDLEIWNTTSHERLHASQRRYTTAAVTAKMCSTRHVRTKSDMYIRKGTSFDTLTVPQGRHNVPQKTCRYEKRYGVALVSRIDQIIGLFSKRAL